MHVIYTSSSGLHPISEGLPQSCTLIRGFTFPSHLYLAGWHGAAFCTFLFHHKDGGYKSPGVWHHQCAPSPPGPRAPGSCGKSQTGTKTRAWDCQGTFLNEKITFDLPPDKTDQWKLNKFFFKKRWWNIPRFVKQLYTKCWNFLISSLSKLNSAKLFPPSHAKTTQHYINDF